MTEDGFYQDTDVQTVSIEMEPGLRMGVDEMIQHLQDVKEDFPEHPVMVGVESWTEVGRDGLWREMWKIDVTVESEED